MCKVLNHPPYQNGNRNYERRNVYRKKDREKDRKITFNLNSQG
jgi:hypothetical protein